MSEKQLKAKHTSALPESIYLFENQGRRKFGDRQSEEAALKEFAARLAFADADHAGHRDVLLNFILSYHKLILRYKDLRLREKRLRFLFTAISLVLLFLIPILIYGIARLPGTEGVVTAQVAAMLTGLLAVHKSLSSWMDKRKVVGNFWKAESDLKAKLYAFEDKWKGKTMQDGKLKDEFLNEARAAIREARAIVQDEQAKFFDVVTYSSIDLGEALKDAGDRAKALVSTHSAPELERRDKQRQFTEVEESKIFQQKEKIVALEIEMKHREQSLARKKAEMADASNEEIEALKSEITAHKSKMRQVEDDLIIAKSHLEALQKSRSM